MGESMNVSPLHQMFIGNALGRCTLFGFERSLTFQIHISWKSDLS